VTNHTKSNERRRARQCQVGVVGVSAALLALAWQGTAFGAPARPAGTPGGPALVATSVVALSPTDVIVAGSRGDRARVREYDGTSWHGLGGPNDADGGLYGVDATSPTDIWVVGSADGYETLTSHWDGTSWQDASQLGFGDYTSLFGVSALSASHVYVAGGYGTEAGDYALFGSLSNGTWDTSALSQDGSSGLSGVDAVSKKDVWAVGYLYDDGLIAHWDGSGFTTTSVGTGSFEAVKAVAADDVWAVGTSAHAYHFDGSSWTPADIPGFPSGGQLDTVTASSASDVWAAGTVPAAGGKVHTLIEHWDGSTWTRVASPNSKQTASEVVSISADSASDAWAVAAIGPDTEYPAGSMLLHWDGTAWTRVPQASLSR
jgi:hypothetical protein